MNTGVLSDQRHNHVYRTPVIFRSIKPYLLISLLFISFSAHNAIATDLKLNDEHLFRYADYLYKNAEYYRAITEFKRLIFYFPDSEYTTPAKLQIGRSYMAGGETKEAEDYWKVQLAKPNDDPETFERIRILLGISLLDREQAYPFSFRKKYIDESLIQFSALSDSTKSSLGLDQFAQEWQNRDIQGMKSPVLAGTLSAIIPGTGSMYSGRYLEGTYALFLTALFAFATNDALRNDNDELAVLFGFFTITFYGGNIYTAVNSAYKTNDKLQSDELLRLREKYGIWFIPATMKYQGRF